MGGGGSFRLESVFSPPLTDQTNGRITKLRDTEGHGSGHALYFIGRPSGDTPCNGLRVYDQGCSARQG